jgi:hypothetical protein
MTGRLCSGPAYAGGERAAAGLPDIPVRPGAKAHGPAGAHRRAPCSSPRGPRCSSASTSSRCGTSSRPCRWPSRRRPLASGSAPRAPRAPISAGMAAGTQTVTKRPTVQPATRQELKARLDANHHLTPTRKASRNSHMTCCLLRGDAPSVARLARFAVMRLRWRCAGVDRSRFGRCGRVPGWLMQVTW